MRCTILAIGSRGDVQPLIALGNGLKSAGFRVRCAAPADFESAVRACDLEFFPLTGNASQFFGGRAGIALRERTRNRKEFIRFFDDYLATFLDKLLVSCWEASQDADCVLVWPWTRVGPSLAERLRIPVITVSVNPVLHLPTREFANPFQGPGELGLGPIYNRLTWLLATPFTRIGQRQIDNWRQRTLGLQPIPWRDELRALRRMPHLFGFSELVLPKPKDWKEWIHVTGYWLLQRPENFQPAPELSAFLDSGPPPVAVGFSSQVGRESKRVTQLAIDALKDSGHRGIFISGWSSLKGITLPPNVFPVSSIPYDWLLPRVSAMVHQGGSGSTSAAILAGVPSFAVPFGYEQALCGRQIKRLGVGLAPIPPSELTVPRLSRAIDELVTNEANRRRARELAPRVQAEDGIGNAVRILERLLAGRPRKEQAVAAHPGWSA